MWPPPPLENFEMRVGGACGVLAVALSGCVSLPAVSLPAAAPPEDAACRAYVEYSADQSAQIATGVSYLAQHKPPGWQALVTALTDYHAMREACRATPAQKESK